MELCEKFGKQGLTFDDVLLIPAESDVTPNMIELRTRLAGNVWLNNPTAICGKQQQAWLLCPCSVPQRFPAYWLCRQEPQVPPVI